MREKLATPNCFAGVNLSNTQIKQPQTKQDLSESVFACLKRATLDVHSPIAVFCTIVQNQKEDAETGAT